MHPTWWRSPGSTSRASTNAISNSIVIGVGQRIGIASFAPNTRLFSTRPAADGMKADLDIVAVDELYHADEVFICTTAGGVMPITQLDGQPVGGGHGQARTVGDLRLATGTDNRVGDGTILVTASELKQP